MATLLAATSRLTERFPDWKSALVSALFLGGMLAFFIWVGVFDPATYAGMH